MLLDNYEITTPAVGYPVTLSEAKAWCRVTHTAEDSLITSLITSATQQLEAYTNRVFSTRGITASFSGLSYSQHEIGPYLSIRRGPLVSVTSVAADGETVSADTYQVRDNSGFARIVFSDLPEYDPCDLVYPITVVFTAGYSTVPEDIKTAIKQYVCLLYSSRGDCDVMPKNIKTIVSHYRILNTFGT